MANQFREQCVQFRKAIAGSRSPVLPLHLRQISCALATVFRMYHLSSFPRAKGPGRFPILTHPGSSKGLGVGSPWECAPAGQVRWKRKPRQPLHGPVVSTRPVDTTPGTHGRHPTGRAGLGDRLVRSSARSRLA